MRLFSRGSNRQVGINIGSTSVKVVELSRGISHGRIKYKVETFAQVPLSDGAIKARRINKQDQVVASLKEAISVAKISSKSAVIGVPGSSIISRQIQMPSGLTEIELESMIELDVDKYITQNINEVRYDFDVIGPSQNEGEIDVLLVASRSDIVDALTSTLADAGLKPGIIDAEPYALEHCYQMLLESNPLFSGGDVAAIVDVGGHSMDISILKDARVVSTREYQIGGEKMTADIQHYYDLEATEAREKKHSGVFDNDFVDTVMEPFVNRLYQDIRGAIQIYETSGEGAPVTKVYLVGGGTRLPGLCDQLRSQLELQVELLEFFSSMQYGKKVNSKELLAQAPSLAVACGLAMRSFN